MSTILVVEDEAEIRSLAQSILEAAGHRTLSAGTISEAIALLEREAQIDLLFTEVELLADVRAGTAEPGLALAAFSAKVRPGLPVICTGRAGIALRARRVIPDASFLPKPYRCEDLLAAVQRTVRPAIRDEGETFGREQASLPQSAGQR